MTQELKKKVISLIEEDFSPQQIEGRLKLENKPSVSHETIYKIIRKDKQEGGNLYKHCPVINSNIESVLQAKKYPLRTAFQSTIETRLST